MSTLRVSALLVVAMLIVLLGSACAATKPVPPAAPAPPPAAQVTAGQLAEQGKAVLAAYGKCHGEDGQGLKAPAIIGANAQLVKYNNGKELLAYISSTMPANAPGTLSQQQYLQVLCFILVQNNYVAATTPVDPNQLERLVLKK